MTKTKNYSWLISSDVNNVHWLHDISATPSSTCMATVYMSYVSWHAFEDSHI